MILLTKVNEMQKTQGDPSVFYLECCVSTNPVTSSLHVFHCFVGN